MYNFNNKQFIFKQSSGRIWNIYYNNQFGICSSNLTKRNSWTIPVSLEKNALETFDACMDSKDRFHIIYQDSHGNISYTRLDESSVVTLPILNSKNPTPYNKYFRILPVKNSIHCFYVLQHRNSLLLTHQALSNKESESPKAIGYAGRGKNPYSAIADKLGNIYVFYQSDITETSEKNTGPQLGYRKYSADNNLWEEFIPISISKINCDYPSIIIDNTGLFHFTYQKHISGRYELVYRQRTLDSRDWSEELTIHISDESYENSSILCIDDRVIVYWVKSDIIYYSYSNDKGISWSRVGRYNFPVGRQLVCISYATNDFYEVNRVSMTNIPGSFLNGFKMAFYQDMLNTDNINSNKEGLRNILSDNLKDINDQIESLFEVNNSLKAEIQKTNLFQRDIIKEMEKYSIRLGLLENELKQIKSDK